MSSHWSQNRVKSNFINHMLFSDIVKIKSKTSLSILYDIIQPVVSIYAILKYI